MTDQPTSAPVWQDGDPTMEAIAAAVWEHCEKQHGSGIVIDDPRNIAAAAVAGIRDAARTAAARQTTGQDDTVRFCPCGNYVAPHPFPGCPTGQDGTEPAPWIADGRHGPTPDEMADRRIPTCYVQFMGGAHCATAPAVGQLAEAQATDRTALRERVRLAVAQWHIDDSGSGRTIYDLDATEFGTLADAVLSVLTVEDER